ncbi:hypothetical protein Zmor_017206 [Zophobas morio]|uniref:Uncharacterized protein n=1 Tax=Zophobas morio TaxID=2755281 RepID=A0AA38I800_9CUCU|nr:hypothetical protein Zmor_017206 [Zophobas morio]
MTPHLDGRAERAGRHVTARRRDWPRRRPLRPLHAAKAGLGAASVINNPARRGDEARPECGGEADEWWAGLRLERDGIGGALSLVGIFDQTFADIAVLCSKQFGSDRCFWRIYSEVNKSQWWCCKET